MSEREKLISHLRFEYITSCGHCDPGSIADFILADRKRIVLPLIKHKKLWCGKWKEYTASQDIDETLQLAGVESKPIQPRKGSGR